jgi:Cof subfamily protein (haloacid dehalogenase superfamily)
MRYRMLALDIDGTLLDPAGELRPAVREAVQRALHAGLRVTLCTGRRFRTALPIARALGLDGPLVLHNGALVKHGATGETLAASYLPGALVPEVLAALLPHGPPLVYVDGWPETDIVTETRSPLSDHQVEYLEHHADHTRFVEDLAGVARDDVIMVSVMTGAAALARLRDDAVRRLGTRVRTHSLENKGYGGHILEFLAVGTGKWAAARRLAEAEGIAPEEIAAVGDDWNDLDLVRDAGLGIAMGNAVPAVRAEADLVVAGNDQGGVVIAIEEVLRAR